MNLAKTIVWTGGELNLWEVCSYFTSGDSNRLAGTVVGVLKGEILEARYEILCTSRWKTQNVEIECRHRNDTHRLMLQLDQSGQWTASGKELKDLSGVVDVDIQVSPSTNTLPIRRLGLAVGESKEVAAAWVKFPQLAIGRLSQRYTRIAGHRYRYESADGQFQAELEVDEFGLVKRYGNYWNALYQRVGGEG